MPQPSTDLAEFAAIPGSDVLWGIPYAYDPKVFTNG